MTIDKQKLLSVTVSRIPDSMLDELENAITELDDEYGIDDDAMRIFRSLIVGYGAAWDALEERNNEDVELGEFKQEEEVPNETPTV